MYKEDQRDRLERSQRMEMLDKLYDSPSSDSTAAKPVRSSSEISVPVPVPTGETAVETSSSNISEEEIIDLDDDELSLIHI